MSLVLLPQLYHRPTAINFRWWIQVFGHMVVVALPIVAILHQGISQSANANGESIANYSSIFRDYGRVRRHSNRPFAACRTRFRSEALHDFVKARVALKRIEERVTRQT